MWMGQTGQGEGAIGRQMVSLVCLPEICQKRKGRNDVFDLDPTAERGTTDCRACRMNLI